MGNSHYTVDSIQAATLVSVLRDRFVRRNISLERLGGECYDGTSTMSGKRGGIAKSISDIELRAVYMYG